MTTKYLAIRTDRTIHLCESKKEILEFARGAVSEKPVPVEVWQLIAQVRPGAPEVHWIENEEDSVQVNPRPTTEAAISAVIALLNNSVCALTGKALSYYRKFGTRGWIIQVPFDFVGDVEAYTLKKFEELGVIIYPNADTSLQPRGKLKAKFNEEYRDWTIAVTVPEGLVESKPHPLREVDVQELVSSLNRRGCVVTGDALKKYKAPGHPTWTINIPYNFVGNMEVYVLKLLKECGIVVDSEADHRKMTLRRDECLQVGLSDIPNRKEWQIEIKLPEEPFLLKTEPELKANNPEPASQDQVTAFLEWLGQAGCILSGNALKFYKRPDTRVWNFHIMKDVVYDWKNDILNQLKKAGILLSSVGEVSTSRRRLKVVVNNNTVNWHVQIRLPDEPFILKE